MEQGFEQLVEGGVSSLFNLLRFHRADRMLHDQDRGIGSAESFALRLRERFKRMRDDGDRESASFLQFDGIVDTPRCARPSISQSADNDIGLSSEFIEVRFGRPLLRGQLSSPDNATHIAILSQQLLKTRLQ